MKTGNVSLGLDNNRRRLAGSALNKVRAMTLCMVLVWIVILLLSEGFGSNYTLFLSYDALTVNKGHYFCIS